MATMLRNMGLNRLGSANLQDRDRMDLLKFSKIITRARINCQIPDQGNQMRTVEKTIAGFAKNTDRSTRDPQHPPRFQSVSGGGGAPLFGGPLEVSFFLAAPSTGNAAALPNLPFNNYTTVSNYFLKRYNKKLDPSMPLVNTGTPRDPVYVPAEFCELIEGQPVKGRLSGDQAQDMINFACRSPYANADSISTTGRDAVLSLTANPLLARFGISVGSQLITVNARQLQSPPIVYGGNKQLRTDGATWNMMNVRFVKPCRRITRWTWVYICTYSPSQTEHAEVKEAVKQWSGFAINNMGVNMEARPLHPDGMVIVARHGEHKDAIRKKVNEALAGNLMPEFAFIVLPEKDTAIYNGVKNIADVDFGFHSVCVVKSKFMKKKFDGGFDMSYFSNVALKVNLKFGGANHALRDENTLIKAGKTMVVGYDVIHPTNLDTDGVNQPSQVGLVASIDKDLAQWPSYYWNQDSKREMLDDTLTLAFVTRLELWQKHNKKQLPENIIIYRDGVSEGQFKQVLEVELPRIRQACAKKYGPKKMPRISIIVSVKRHATRFYPTDPAHMDPKSRNIKNGTVVDRGVTQARYWEFFLTAHSALQGTARPARYVVILDEVFRATMGAGAADGLEKLTHDLCYLYGRATKAVSICPPAYYADIVCTRARVHMDALFDAGSAGSEVSSNAAQTIMQRTAHERLKDSMYYI